MKTFRTPVDIPGYPFRMEYKHKYIAVGSCFASHIGDRLHSLKFNIAVHPCGILYNPISISRCLKLILGETKLGEDDFIFNNDLWFSWDHHGKFSNADKKELTQQINRELSKAREKIGNETIMLITLGTAHTWIIKDKARTVANCHKLPIQSFDRKRPSIDEHFNALDEVFQLLFKSHPNLKILMSVSPVRYRRDGWTESNRSKAVLHLTVERLCHKHQNVYYFPAYELIMDDLRNYRFYAEDMLHPSATAVDYVWEKMEAALMDQETQNLSKQISKVVRSLHHKPLKAGSKQTKNWLDKIQIQIDEITSNYPEIDFMAEQAQLKELTDSSPI